MTLNKENAAAVAAEKEEDDAFNSGFSDEPAATAAKKPENEAAAEDTAAAEIIEKEEQAAVEGEEPAAAAGEGAEQPVVTTASLTTDQLKILEAAAAKVPELEKQNSKLFGTVGEMQRRLNAMKAGKADDASATKDDKPDALGKLVGDTVEARIRERANEELAEVHPDWRKVVGAPPEEGAPEDWAPDLNNPYRKWLATQPKEYIDKINGSNSATVISRSIDKFKAATATPPAAQPGNKAKLVAKNKADAERRDLIANSKTPKSAGSQPARSKTADDEFAEGFAEG